VLACAQAGNAQAGNLRQGMRGAAGKKALFPFAMNPQLSEPTLTQTRRRPPAAQAKRGTQAPERMKKRAEGCHYQ